MGIHKIIIEQLSQKLLFVLVLGEGQTHHCCVGVTRKDRDHYYQSFQSLWFVPPPPAFSKMRVCPWARACQVAEDDFELVSSCFTSWTLGSQARATTSLMLCLESSPGLCVRSVGTELAVPHAHPSSRCSALHDVRSEHGFLRFFFFFCSQPLFAQDIFM